MVSLLGFDQDGCGPILTGATGTLLGISYICLYDAELRVEKVTQTKYLIAKWWVSLAAVVM